MEVHVTPELEARLIRTAARQGRNPDEVAQEILSCWFEDETRFIEAVTLGEDSLQRGEYLTHEQVGQRLQRFLHP